MWDFDAVSLYPSAMSDEKSIYPRIETGYAFTPTMKDERVKKINEGNVTQGSANLKKILIQSKKFNRSTSPC